ncbi:hypothetical protein PITCH_A1280055 [uncultured Desulfobacterium sp.]|uniref:Uncharacterized protein n=1 Tax=uncultured Desulfobacterium sp. TaxID=201089 RepID=A0A445MS99_9BACT|nr:hypothetical protein PITCH_A1280055 [uncultured Desulfobacterium sp.]
MRRLPFHILLACIFLPPILYMLSLQALEILVQKKWKAELQGLLVTDGRALLEGRIGIEDEINRNVEKYIASRTILKWGVLAQITVKTGTGKWLYPASAKQMLYTFNPENYPQERPSPAPTETMSIAENNLRVMDEGIELFLSVQIPRNTWIANSLLFVYLAIFTSILYNAYQKSSREGKRLEKKNIEALESANKNLLGAQDRLRDVTARETSYLQEIERLKKDLSTVSDRVRETEDEALEQMDQLEKSLRESVGLKEELELEVNRLSSEMEKIEAQQKTPIKKQRKQIETTIKRFKTLYKNLEIQERAVEGFLDLEGELQLKAEELIHNMNEDSTRLSVKRKIFSKKGSTPTFECEFGYRGRIYFRPGPGARVQVLTIGTKNTQTKDLAYIEGV